MRILLKIEIPTQKGNEVIKKGTLAQTMKSILDEQKPESAYFATSGGNRAGYLVFDLKDAADMPKIAEPWFLAFDAKIDASPVMTPEDLGKAGPAIEQAVKKYGSM